MTFAVPADAYDRFMGRYSTQLAPALCDLAHVAVGQRVLEVGCGTGALTRELVARLGLHKVAAVDPSPPFVQAARSRFPGLDVQLTGAEELPFEDAAFDVALAQLVVQFMSDPAQGVGEMRRITRQGGVVAACVWDHGGGRGPLSPLWDAVRQIDPGAEGESRSLGTQQGDLTRLFAAVGLREVSEAELAVSFEHPSFDDWWEPYTFGIGPAGAYIAGLEDGKRERLRQAAREALGEGPFTVDAVAWTASGTV